MKSLLIINFLLIAIQLVHCGPVKGNGTLSSENELITFDLINTVQINGTDFNELNCIAKSSLDRKACANITQVTCEEVSIGEVRSCSVSNDDSIFVNSSVSNEALVCADANQTKNNCYLRFSLNEETGLKTAGHFENDGRFASNPMTIDGFDDEFEKRKRKAEEDADRIVRIVFISMAVFFAIIFGIPICFCCLVFVNLCCFGGRYNLPLDRTIRESSCLGLRETEEYSQGVTIQTTYR